jgi:hypothetical protein
MIGKILKIINSGVVILTTEENFTPEQKQIKLFICLATRIFVSYYNFRKLFEVKNSREIVMEIAPEFFRLLNDLLIRDFFLETAKLIENENYQYKKNITVKLIVNMPMWNEEQRKKLNKYNEDLEVLKIQMKKARHKIIAHNDLATYEDDTIESLGEFDIGLDKKFISTLEEFCNYIHKEAFGEIWGDFNPSSPGDVDELIGYLYRGKVFHQVVKDSSTSSEVRGALVHRLLELRRGRIS